MLLGEMLVQKNVLSDGELQQFLSQAKTEGKMLGEILVNSGIITKEQLFEFLQEQGFLKRRPS
ncbi:MAG: hypothetical protein AABZ39_13800 [Spirochaetota bacterium]